MGEVMESWFERNGNELVASWNSPDMTISDEKGDRIFIYYYSGVAVLPRDSSHSFGTTTFHSPSSVIQLRRKRMFWVNSNGIIHY